MDDLTNKEAEEQNAAQEEMTEEQMMSVMFSNMVVQQARTALFALGQIPDPQTGQRVLELETAQMLIGTLEMLKEKTKGNLSKEEDELLTQSLEKLHITFEKTIEALQKMQSKRPQTTEAGIITPPGAGHIVTPEGVDAGIGRKESSPIVTDTSVEDAKKVEREEEESRKKFSKKY